MNFKSLFSGLLLAGLGLSFQANAYEYQVDPAKTTVKIKLTGMKAMTAVIHPDSGQVSYDPAAPEKTRIHLKLNANKIEAGTFTPLFQSESVFNATKYPDIIFTSTKSVPAGNNRVTVYGNLTMKGVTKPVKWDAVIDPQTDGKSGAFTANAAINRHDWGLSGFRSLVDNKAEMTIRAVSK